MLKNVNLSSLTAMSLFGICVTAFSADLSTPLSPSLWVASNHDTQAAIGPAVGSTTVSQPSWGVSQWILNPDGSQASIPANQKLGYIAGAGGWNNYIHNEFHGTNNNWWIANSAVAVSYDAVTQPWLNGVYTLAQNGKVLNNLPCGGEYDLFLGPKGPLQGYGTLANSAPNGFVSSKPLAQLDSLILHAGFKVTYENIEPKCNGLDQDKVVYGVGIFLRNLSNNKTFFYQLNFRSSLDPYPVANGYYEGFADAHGNIGVGDSVVNVANWVAIPQPGSGRVAYSAINVLPRLKSIISKGSMPVIGGTTAYFDSNLNNWRVDGMFFGQYLWGGVNAASEWDNVRLQAFP